MKTMMRNMAMKMKMDSISRVLTHLLWNFLASSIMVPITNAESLNTKKATFAKEDSPKVTGHKRKTLF